MEAVSIAACFDLGVLQEILAGVPLDPETAARVAEAVSIGSGGAEP